MINKMKKKFEEMDDIIKNFDELSDDDRCNFIEKEINNFNNLSEEEKIETYSSLFINALMNNLYCNDRLTMTIEFYIKMISNIRKSVVNNNNTDDILESIDLFLSVLEKDSKEIRKKLKFNRN